MKTPAKTPDPLVACLACFLFFGAAPLAFSQGATVAFAPMPLPQIPDPAAETARLQAEDRAQRMRFFEAIAANDLAKFVEVLNEGIDPNATIPAPAPKEFAAKFQDERLEYYLTREQGFTGLMMATALGNNTFVRYLLLAGADPYKMTKKHRTYALWLAAKYGHLDIMRTLMGIGPDHASMAYRIEVNLALQKVTLWHDGRLALSGEISSGRTSHPTPTGEFLVTDKYKMWKSTLYDAKMPYFLRLSCGDFGMHVGALPGYPASHGCIRLPEKVAKELFKTVPIGTLVEIR